MLPPAATGSTPRRRDRAIALFVDLGWGAIAMLLATMVAVPLLFVRSGWGGRNISEGDSIAAAALIGAAVPAWLAWLALGLAWDRATPGQRRRRLLVSVARRGRPAPLALRLMLHPVAVPGWLWLTILVWLTTIPLLPALLAALTVTLAILGIISALLVSLDPAAPAMHDRLAGTRIRRREYVDE